MRVVVVGLMALCLAGCAGAGANSPFVSPAGITKPIYALKGQKIDAAIAYMGLPDGEMTIANRKIILWNSKDTQSFSNYNSYGSTPALPFVNGTTRKFYCVVKAVMGPEDVITEIEIDSNSDYYCPRGK